MAQPHPRFIVMDRSAAMPNSCWGRYRRVGVVELTPDAQREGRTPKILSDHSRDVVRVVEIWERRFEGRHWGAYQSALVEAKALTEKLNDISAYV